MSMILHVSSRPVSIRVSTNGSGSALWLTFKDGFADDRDAASMGMTLEDAEALREALADAIAKAHENRKVSGWGS